MSRAESPGVGGEGWPRCQHGRSERRAASWTLLAGQQPHIQAGHGLQGPRWTGSGGSWGPWRAEPLGVPCTLDALCRGMCAHGHGPHEFLSMEPQAPVL